MGLRTKIDAFLLKRGRDRIKPFRPARQPEAHLCPVPPSTLRPNGRKRDDATPARSLRAAAAQKPGIASVDAGELASPPESIHRNRGCRDQAYAERCAHSEPDQMIVLCRAIDRSSIAVNAKSRSRRPHSKKAGRSGWATPHFCKNAKL